MGDCGAWIIECMPDVMIVLLNDNIFHLCWWPQMILKCFFYHLKWNIFILTFWAV